MTRKTKTETDPHTTTTADAPPLATASMPPIPTPPPDFLGSTLGPFMEKITRATMADQLAAHIFRDSITVANCATPLAQIPDDELMRRAAAAVHAANIFTDAAKAYAQADHLSGVIGHGRAAFEAAYPAPATPNPADEIVRAN